MERGRGAGAAPFIPGGLHRGLEGQRSLLLLLWPAGRLESWEESGGDAQAEGAHPREEGAEGGGAVLGRPGRGGRQDGGEGRGGEGGGEAGGGGEGRGRAGGRERGGIGGGFVGGAQRLAAEVGVLGFGDELHSEHQFFSLRKRFSRRAITPSSSGRSKLLLERMNPSHLRPSSTVRKTTLPTVTGEKVTGRNGRWEPMGDPVEK